MTFLAIYIGFSLLTFLVAMITAININFQIKSEYPGLLEERETNINDDAGTIASCFSLMKVFIVCFVPIINIAIFCVTLLYEDDVKKDIIRKMKEQVKGDKENEDSITWKNN